MLPRFEVVARRRPVDLIAPGSVQAEAPLATSGEAPAPQPAPYAAVVADLDGPPPGQGRLGLALVGADRSRLVVRWDAGSGAVGLRVVAGGRTTHHRSRRHGAVAAPPSGLALTLTGTHLSVLTCEQGEWLVRGRVDLRGRLDTREEAWLTGLVAEQHWDHGVGGGRAPAGRWRVGGFGQLGLRDLRVVTTEDGAPWTPAGRVLLSATSAGPGFFDTAHTSVWELDPDSLALRHLSDLFFRRPDRPGAYGDHATHLVRRSAASGTGEDTGGHDWLVATSTWGDFDASHADARVEVTLAETSADLLTGRHLLDTRPLPLPTGALRSVGTWDPHLVRDGDRWLVGFVSARKFFSFHPALAAGPGLDRLSLLGAASERVATEGTTLVRVPDGGLDGGWRVLASDGRDGRRGARRQYPVFDLAMTQVGVLDAAYPSNIPWPTVVPLDGDGWLMVTFDGTPAGGPLPGYGTHGDLLVLRPAP